MPVDGAVGSDGQRKVLTAAWPTNTDQLHRCRRSTRWWFGGYRQVAVGGRHVRAIALAERGRRLCRVSPGALEASQLEEVVRFDEGQEPSTGPSLRSRRSRRKEPSGCPHPKTRPDRQRVERPTSECTCRSSSLPTPEASGDTAASTGTSRCNCGKPARSGARCSCT